MGALSYRMATPLYINRFYSGLHTNRSALVTPYVFAGLNRVEQHDVLIDGANVEVNDKQTLQRRPGFPKYCTQQLASGEIPRSFHTWRDANGSLKMVSDLTTNVSTVTSSVVTSLFSLGSTAASFQSVGAILYVAAGTTLKKYNPGTGVVSGWGITAPATAPTIAQTNSASGVPSAASGTNWTNPTNVYSSNNTYAVYNAATQDLLKMTGFSFSLPTTVTITGFLITVEGNSSSGTTANRQIQVAITKDGATAAGTWQDITLPQTTDSTQTVGSSTSMMGVTAVKADVEASTFGVVLRDNDTTAADIEIDYVALTVYFTVDDGLAPTNGYRWVYVYKNSTTGHISSASTESASTGVISRRAKIVLSGSDSSDTQVDQIEIYRTKDGGSIYYFVASLTHSVGWTYTDTAADSALTLTKTAPLNGLNGPPPSPMHLTVFHMGRMWGAVDNVLYFGGGGDILNGVPEECWPATNYFVFPAKLQALVPTQFGLLVFTASDSYIVRGVDSFSFFPQLFQAGLGVLSPHCVKLDGQTLYLYTSQRQLLSLSTQRDAIGFPIADLLNASFAPASCYLAAHRDGTDDALYLSDGSTTIYRWSKIIRAWSPAATVVNGCKALASVEVADGDWRLLLGRASAQDYILNRDETIFADNGSAYASCFATFGSLVLSPPKGLATVTAILTERTSAGNELQISVLPQETSGTFINLSRPVDEPPQFPASTTAIGKRWYLKGSDTPLCEEMQHLQVKVTFPAGTAKNELLGLGLDMMGQEN